MTLNISSKHSLSHLYLWHNPSPPITSKIYLLLTICMYILWYRKVVFIVRFKTYWVIAIGMHVGVCKPYFPIIAHHLNFGFDSWFLCRDWKQQFCGISASKTDLCTNTILVPLKRSQHAECTEIHEKLVSWAVASGQTDKIWIFYRSEPGRPIFVGL